MNHDMELDVELELTGYFADIHCDFWLHCSTIDQLIVTKAVLQNSFLHYQHVISVFIDLEKACQRRHAKTCLGELCQLEVSILQALHEAGMHGRLPVILHNFLSVQVFRVQMELLYPLCFIVCPGQ